MQSKYPAHSARCLRDWDFSESLNICAFWNLYSSNFNHNYNTFIIIIIIIMCAASVIFIGSEREFDNPNSTRVRYIYIHLNVLGRVKSHFSTRNPMYGLNKRAFSFLKLCVETRKRRTTLKFFKRVDGIRQHEDPWSLKINKTTIDDQTFLMVQNLDVSNY